MTREEAAQVLQEQIEFIEDDQAYSMLTKSMYEDGYKRMDAYKLAIAALLGPQPDPDTGLVPCGCGGKAQMGKLLYTGNDPDLMPDLMTEYYAYCQDCGITTDNSTDMERVENEWNRAMGWREGNEN